MTSSGIYHPHQQREQAADRKVLFAAINEMVTKAGAGWLVSVPGAANVALECLPGATLPSELAEMGYKLKAEKPDGQRLLPTAITNAVIMEGSTVPMMVTHAGIVTVERFSFRLP